MPARRILLQAAVEIHWRSSMVRAWVLMVSTMAVATTLECCSSMTIPLCTDWRRHVAFQSHQFYRERPGAHSTLRALISIGLEDLGNILGLDRMDEAGHVEIDQHPLATRSDHGAVAGAAHPQIAGGVQLHSLARLEIRKLVHSASSGSPCWDRGRARWPTSWSASPASTSAAGAPRRGSAADWP